MLISLAAAMLSIMVTDSAVAPDTLNLLDPIIVVGNREPIRLSRTVNSGISLTPAQVEATPQDNILANLTSNFASVSLSSTKSVGYGLGSVGQGKLLIRGLGFSPNVGTLVLIDGRPDQAGLFGHPLPDTYQKAGLASADLIKGGASTLYGSSALAGVLDLTSFHRPDRDRYTHLELSGGSFETVTGSIQHSQKVGRAVLAGWYEYLQSDNQGDNNEFLSRSGGVRTQFNAIDGWDLFMSARVTSFFFADPGPEYDLLRSTGDIIRSGVTLGADRPGDRLSLSARLYNSYGEHAFSDGFNSVDRNNGADLFARLRPSRLSWLSISGGGSFNRLGGSAYDGTAFTKAGNFGHYEYSGHLQTELRPDSALTLIAGGRVISHERFGSHFVYQLGSVITPGKVGSFKLSTATAYRNPTVMESQLFMISNSETLEPEEATFYEVGYFGRPARSVSIEACLFWRRGSNLIATLPNPTPPPMVRFGNSGSYDHSGWESTVTFASGSWRLSPSFMHLNQTSFLKSVPEDKLVISAAYAQSRWSAALETVAAFKTHSDSTLAGGSTLPVTLEDYAVVNLNARFRIGQFSALTVRCENLFDRGYQIVHGYPMPGFTLRAGFDFQF